MEHHLNQMSNHICNYSKSPFTAKHSYPINGVQVISHISIGFLLKIQTLYELLGSITHVKSIFSMQQDNQQEELWVALKTTGFRCFKWSDPEVTSDVNQKSSESKCISVNKKGNTLIQLHLRELAPQRLLGNLHVTNYHTFTNMEQFHLKNKMGIKLKFLTTA